MDFKVTLWLFLGFVAVAIFCGWRGALPSQPAKGVRMIPWRPLMVASALGAFLMLIHMASFRTGS